MEFLSVFGSWCGGPGFWQTGGGGWMMPFHFGGIVPLLVLGLIIYFTVRMMRPTRATGPDSASEILRNRFANGEIDEQTYQSMKKELNKS